MENSENYWFSTFFFFQDKRFKHVERSLYKSNLWIALHLSCCFYSHNSCLHKIAKHTSQIYDSPCLFNPSLTHSHTALSSCGQTGAASNPAVRLWSPLFLPHPPSRMYTLPFASRHHKPPPHLPFTSPRHSLCPRGCLPSRITRPPLPPRKSTLTSPLHLYLHHWHHLEFIESAWRSLTTPWPSWGVWFSCWHYITCLMEEGQEGTEQVGVKLRL